MQFLREYPATPKEFHKGLYLPFGVGKSFLLGAMANAQQNVDLLRQVHFPTFTVEMKQAISRSDWWKSLMQ